MHIESLHDFQQGLDHQDDEEMLRMADIFLAPCTSNASFLEGESSNTTLKGAAGVLLSLSAVSMPRQFQTHEKKAKVNHTQCTASCPRALSAFPNYPRALNHKNGLTEFWMRRLKLEYVCPEH